MAPTFVSGIPIYVQIADDIRAQILRGTLRAGDQLTSTTEYSATYRINPATVGKRAWPWASTSTPSSTTSARTAPTRPPRTTHDHPHLH